MAGALSTTTCSTAPVSVFDTARIASMSFTPVRPMVSSVVDMSTTSLAAAGMGTATVTEGGKDEGTGEGACRRRLGELDVPGRSQEVGDHDAAEPLGQPGGLLGADERREPRGEEGRGRLDDAGQALDGQVGGHVPRGRAEHGLEMDVALERRGRRDEHAYHEVLERRGRLELGRERFEELAGLALAQGVEQDVLAPGEEPVERRA